MKMTQKASDRDTLLINTYKVLSDTSFMYHPDAIRGRKPNYDEVIRDVWYVIMKDEIDNFNPLITETKEDIIKKSLLFIERVAEIDTSKKEYPLIYRKGIYFKKDVNEKFNIRQVGKQFYLSRRQISYIIEKCNHLIKNFLVLSMIIEMRDKYNIDDESFRKIKKQYGIEIQPYYGFCDYKFYNDMDRIANELGLKI